MIDEARLERLIGAYFDQSLTADEKRELERMLLASARAREFYLERCEWHGAMREWALQSLSGEWLQGEGTEETRPVAATRWWLPAVALTACLALGAWLYFSSGGKERPQPGNALPNTSLKEPGPQTGGHVAYLGLATNVEWDPGSPAYPAGAALPTGPLHIRKGILRLDFYSGARVLLEGPASLDLQSTTLAQLDHGKLTAHVPPPAEGFSIITNQLKVVDRGTDFGIRANGPDGCEVHVFEGRVELQGSIPNGQPSDLSKGDAVSIHHGQWQKLQADRRQFADPRSIQEAMSQENQNHWAAWQRNSSDFSKTQDLLVYFDFEGLDSGETKVANRAAGAAPDSSGTVIGCDRLTGRWTRKAALGFARTSDRVRFRTEGATADLTLMAWVRVDSLPLNHNSLLSMSPDQLGEVHWKLDRSGCLLIGLRAAQEFSFQSWERLQSPPVITDQDFGHWLHLATTIDGTQGIMKHFVNGREVASSAMMRRPMIQLGLANLGNFDPGTLTALEPGMIRSFNGRIDEFALLKRALTAGEIATYYKKAAIEPKSE